MLLIIMFFSSLIGINEGSDLNFLSVSPEIENLVSKKCTDDVYLLGDSLRNLTPWAVEMWEASAREETGMLLGSMYQLGNFDGCFGTFNQDQEVGVERQYCLSVLAVEGDLLESDDVRNTILKHGQGVSWGLCAPASCTNEDLILILKDYHYFKCFYEKFNLTHRVLTNVCQTDPSEESYTSGSIAFICCFCILVILALLATIYHCHLEMKNENKQSCPEAIRAFSILHNWRELARKDDKRLRIFHGLRVLVCIWIISCHHVGIMPNAPLVNSRYMEAVVTNYDALGILIMGVGTSVDVFFVFGGFFALFSLTRNFESKNKLEIVISRYFRLIPLNGLVIFFIATLYRQLGSGPLWFVNEAESSGCSKNWWTNLLFINNYVNVDEICMANSWYVAADFHYYLITIALCYFLAVPTREKTGLIITGLLLMLSTAIPALVIYSNRFGPTLQFTKEVMKAIRINEEFQHAYIPSHMRMGPYICGIFAAYIYGKYKKADVKISKIYSILILLMAVIVFFVNMAFVYDLVISPYDLFWSTLYGALHRHVSGLCVAIIILILIFGDVPVVTPFLSCAPMIILGKLTFGAYLISISVQLTHIMSMKNLGVFNIAYLISDGTWLMIVSFFLSLIGYLTIEAPCNTLMKMLLKTNKRFSCMKKNNEDYQI